MTTSILYSKFSILRKAGLITILAVLVLTLTPESASAATIQPEQIQIRVSTASGLAPVYKYVIADRSSLTIPLKLTLIQPGAIQAGDELAIEAARDFRVNGVYLGLDQTPLSNCDYGGTSVSYTVCDFQFDNDNADKGFKVVSLKQGQEVDYSVTLTYDDLASLGVINPQGGAPFKILYFGIVLDLSPYLLSVTAPDLTLVTPYAIKIYPFANQAAADQAQVDESGVRPSATTALDARFISDDSGLAGTLISVLNIIIGAVVTIVGSIIKYLGAIIIVPILEATLSMDASQFAGGPILAGWTFVRDVVNMFFILFLIIIGFGTILKIESYNYKKLLVNLIVMALLVNFSLAIARIILQISDTAQFSFLPVSTVVEGGEGITGVRYLYQKLSTEHLSKIVDGFRVFSTSTSGALAGTMTLLFEFILQLAVVITFGAMAAFMLIRTVAIYILLVLSPFAFALLVVPATKGTAQKWWSNYIKYVLFGPIFAFFLRLDFEIYARGMKLLPSLFDKTITNPDTVDYLNLLKNQNGGVTFAQMLQLGTIFVVILAFKWAELLIAKDMGIAGAGAIVGLAERGLKAPFAGGAWLGKRGVGYVGRKWNDLTSKLLEAEAGKRPPGKLRKAAFAVLNPVAFARGWEQRAQELKEISKTTAATGGREVAEQFLTRGKLRIPYRSFSERVDENKFLKDYENMRKESLMDAGVTAEGLKGPEGELRRRAIVKAAASQGYLDDLLRMKHFANKYADKDGTFYSAGVLNRFLYGYLGHGEQAQRFMAEDMEQLGKNTGHFEYLGHAYYDPSAKGFQRGMEVAGEEELDRGGQKVKIQKLKNTWQAAYSSGELAKTGGRVRAGIAPHNIVALRAETDAQGNFIEAGEELSSTVKFGRKDGTLDESQIATLGVVGGPATLRDIHFAQDRTKDWVLSGNVDKNTGEIIVDSKEEYDKIENMWKQQPEFVKAMYEQHTGIKNATGLKIAWYDKNPQTGAVRDKIRKTIGDPEATQLPIIDVVAQEVSKNPTHKLSESDQRKIRQSVESILPDAYLGKIDESSVRAELQQKLAGMTFAPGVSTDTITEDIYQKVRLQTESRYNPMPVIKAIDARLAKRQQPKMTAEQMSRISHEVSAAIGEAYEEASRRGVKLAKDPMVLRNKVTGILFNKPGLPAFTQEDLEIFVQHARPHP